MEKKEFYWLIERNYEKFLRRMWFRDMMVNCGKLWKIVFAECSFVVWW